MKGSRFSEEQIIGLLPALEIPCRRHTSNSCVRQRHEILFELLVPKVVPEVGVMTKRRFVTCSDPRPAPHPSVPSWLQMPTRLS